MGLSCRTARVQNRRRVGIHSEVRLTQAYPGADRCNTIVPAGTTFDVVGIRQYFDHDGSRVMLHGMWGDKRISVPAKDCQKVT